MRKEIHVRVDSELHEHVKKKARNENKTMNEVIEEMIRHDIKLKNDYVDDLADAISNKLNEKLKSMRIAINENNKILKVQQHVINYQLLAQNLTMKYDEYGDYEHFAFEHATEKMKEEIKRMQVIKAEQRKKFK